MEKNSNEETHTTESLEKFICEEEVNAESCENVEQILKELQIIESGSTCQEFPCDPHERIRCGFHLFKREKFDKHREFYRQLAEGQNPQAFMFRNIANLVPPYDKTRYSGVGAVLEYAILSLKVPNILVVGHSRCGGIKRLMSDDPKSSYFIDDWMSIAQPAKDKVKQEASHLPPEEQIKLCEMEAVKLSLANLLSYPFVRDAAAEKTLALKGGYYDFVNGRFDLWPFHI